MGYRTAELPPVDLDEFATIPFFPRMKILMLHWVEEGFGTPKQTATFYAWKIFFYGLFGLIVAGAFTAGLEFNNIGGWWDEPILYQKLMIWTILLEILGCACPRTRTTCRSRRATGARRGTPGSTRSSSSG